MAVIAVMMFRFVEPHAMESDLYRDLAPVAPVAPVAPDLGSDLTWDLTSVISVISVIGTRFIQRFTHNFPV